MALRSSGTDAQFLRNMHMMQGYKDLVIQAKNDSKYMQSFLCIMEPLVKSYAKKNLKKEKYECAYMDNEGDLQESYRADYSSVELAFDLKNITLKMTSNQRTILKYLILGWSDSEIASFLHFSRQYVNREKKKIYQFLK